MRPVIAPRFAQRYLAWFAGAVAVLLVAVAAFNRLVDPESVFGAPTIDAVNGVRPLATGDRVAKAAETARGGYTALLAGLIVVQAAIALPAWPYLLDVYNPLAGGLSGALRTLAVGWGEGGERIAAHLNAQAEGDLVLEGEGQKVVVDEVSLPFLSNAVIDFTEELIGARFTIENPNATSSCGCGTSFSV